MLEHSPLTKVLTWIAGVALFGTSFLMLLAVWATWGLGHAALAFCTWPISLVVVAFLALMNGAPTMALAGIGVPAACIALIQWLAPRTD